MIEASDFISTRKEVLHPSYGKGVEVTVRQSLSWTTFVSDRTLQTVDHAGCKNALSMTEGNLMRGIKHEIYGEVIDVRRKALKNGVPKEHVNWKIRNLDGGFIFAKEGFRGFGFPGGF